MYFVVTTLVFFLNKQVMKKFTSLRSSIKLSAVCLFAAAALTASITACNKSRTVATPATNDEILKKESRTPLLQNEQITSVVTVAMIRPTADGSATRVMFNQNEEIFTVSDPADISVLKNALAANQAVQISFDPWRATVSHVSISKAEDQAYFHAKPIVSTPGITMKIDQTTSADVIDRATSMGVLNLTTDTLTNVIPDFNTAQLMFDYIAHQCCQLAGPYAVDHCITFQYCPDGCYARAHKMCMIINSKYHFGTQKVFSFANAGSDELCVKAEKWGGCCINWWYHVAPLVTIKTPTGPKAYVFDPAMFDQPVLLSTWLHAQTNPACSGGYTPHVSMINIQPNSSYSPSSGSGYTFDTDPGDVNANSTLVSYRSLISCP